MSDNFISNVLNILRLIKNTNLSGHAPSEYIKAWSGLTPDDAGTLRVCAYIVDQCDGALSLINQSQLAEEAKAGLVQTVQAVKSGFSISNLNQSLHNHFPQLDASISSFAILESVSNLSGPSPDVPELADLISDVEAMIALFDDAEIDPIVRSTARRHLHVLLTLLKNVQALGIDAAMAAYAELVVRLRRVDATASETARAKTAKAWPAIEKWAGRLAIIDKAYNSGHGLLTKAEDLGRLLLGYLS